MKVLVIVDMQNDFVTGTLGTKEAQAIVPNVIEKVKHAEENGDTVVFTQDTHESNYMNTKEGRALPVKHCIEGTDGWTIVPELSDFPKNTRIFQKNTFGSKNLANFLSDKYIEAVSIDDKLKVEFVGLCTGICVISNVLLTKAFIPEAEIIVDSSCCACVTPESHTNALKAMKMCQIDIINDGGALK